MIFSRTSRTCTPRTRITSACRLTFLAVLILAGATCWPSLCHADTPSDSNRFPLNAKKILFMGDSITHAGHYVACLETQLRLQLDAAPMLLNLGLPSETCSGLSEPQHPFPRPDVHERLERALEKVKPDVVVACYGMNDGIYYPFGVERFEKYQAGIRLLVKKVHASGAKCILMTPPPFDPEPMRAKGKLLPKDAKQFAYFAIYEDYDDVLQRYGQWLQEEMKDEVAMVIDLHAPVTAALTAARKQDPNFRFAGDGVHMNAAGHKIMGIQILKAWGLKPVDEPPKLLPLVEKKTRVLHDAWLTHVGHKRPGGKPGPPLAEAQEKAKQLEQQIQTLLESR